MQNMAPLVRIIFSGYENERTRRVCEGSEWNPIPTQGGRYERDILRHDGCSPANADTPEIVAVQHYQKSCCTCHL